jgi:hypothetical protein
MLGYDRIGPMGQGTGRGQGSCSVDTLSSSGTRGAGLGRGMGRRGGNRFAWNQAPVFGQYSEGNVQEVDMLKTEASAIKQTLEQINNRIKNLEKPIEDI